MRECFYFKNALIITSALYYLGIEKLGVLRSEKEIVLAF
jgi:hypothetical protein